MKTALLILAGFWIGSLVFLIGGWIFFDAREVPHDSAFGE